jgi:uncharacterized protein (TIGR04255 family)
MSSGPYRRPPITEAVVELRLGDQIDIDQVDRIKDRLADDYPISPQTIQNISLIAGPGNQNRTQVEFGAYKLLSADATNAAVISRQHITNSRLAPYNGWEDFTEQAKRNWTVWRKVAGWHPISRVGVRYINRIDVPNPDEKPLPIDDYLVFRPIFPEFEGWQGVDTFAINAAAVIANTPFKCRVHAESLDPHDVIFTRYRYQPGG